MMSPRLSLVIAVVASGACTGVMSGGDEGPASGVGPDGVPTGAPRPPVQPPGTPDRPTPITPDPGPGAPPPVAVPPPAACSGKTTLGASAMRRLTNAEYAATVRALLAIPADAPLQLDLPGETRVASFENNATVQSLSEQHATQYLAAAERLTASLLADTKRRDAVVGCSPAGATRATCTRSFITRFGRRAFRRPPTDDEVTRYLALAAKGDGEADPYAGVERVMQAMLVSSPFLFLVETGAPDPQRPGVVKLGGAELATRLSYLLLGTPPDDALLDAAAAGKLDAAAGVLETTRAMLKDPAGLRAQRGFYTRWLQLDLIDDVELDVKKYPSWGEPLRRSMLEESTRFVDDLVARPSASFLGLVTADWSFVDGALAKIYGVATPATAFARVQFGAGQRGGGLLTHGSFLAATGISETVTPIKRGLFVRQVLLCQTMPPPPPDVPSIEDVKLPDGTLRERLAAHEKAPACSGCHSLLDPIGFGLSQYDAVGAYRPMDAKGRAVDARGSISGLGDFEGPRQLGALLERSPELSQCVARQMFRYATARLELPEDACALGAVHDTFVRGGYGYQALVEAVVQTDAFRFRRPAAGGAP